MDSNELKRSHDMNLPKTISDEGKGKESRTEKKIRKLLENFSYDKFSRVKKIHFHKARNVIFKIDCPNIFKSSVNGSFLIFGEAKAENGNNI
nr:nascent polypeptide-associated complex subunit alpha-like protein 1 [Cryptomonas sp.]